MPNSNKRKARGKRCVVSRISQVSMWGLKDCFFHYSIPSHWEIVPQIRMLCTSQPGNVCRGLTLPGWLQQLPSAVRCRDGWLWHSDNGSFKGFSQKASFAHFLTVRAWQMGMGWHGEAKRVCIQLMTERTACQHSGSVVLHINCSTLLLCKGHL